MFPLKKLKILIVDDHPVILEACESILASLNPDLQEINIDSARHCDSAINYIKVAAKTNTYDILFLDINLPPSSDGNIIDGEDLALFAKEKLPKAKIIILTAINENHRIKNILKTINPNGLLIKSDINSNELLTAFNAVMYNTPYYSSTVMKFLRNQVSMDVHEPLDSINRKIIFYLAKGVKTKNLVKYINLSLSAIEKRKSYIKQIFELENGDDAAIVEKAKNLGFI